MVVERKDGSSEKRWFHMVVLRPHKLRVPVAVILRATTKQDEGKVNCQDVSQSAQGGDKSRRTCQLLWSVLECVSFIQGPIEVSHSRQERGVGRRQVRLLLRKLRGLYTYCAIYLLSYYGVFESKQ